MTLFWIMTAVMATLAGLLVLAGARRGVDLVEPVTPVTASAELAELDKLKARGLLDEAAWTAARAEAGRRILSAQREAAPLAAGPRDRVWVLASIFAAVAGAVALYFFAGAPGLADQPFERRVDEWSTQLDTLQPPQVAAVVARAVKERPGDAEALTMLGVARAEAGDPIGAVSAFRRATALQPDDALGCPRLAASLVRANRGAVSGNAEAVFRRALELDPSQTAARYFLGDAALLRGDKAQAVEMWSPLLASLPPEDPARLEMQARLEGSGS